jgi:hypothetical protein
MGQGRHDGSSQLAAVIHGRAYGIDAAAGLIGIAQITEILIEMLPIEALDFAAVD